MAILYFIGYLSTMVLLQWCLSLLPLNPIDISIPVYGSHPVSIGILLSFILLMWSGYLYTIHCVLQSERVWNIASRHGNVSCFAAYMALALTAFWLGPIVTWWQDPMGALIYNGLIFTPMYITTLYFSLLDRGVFRKLSFSGPKTIHRYCCQFHE